MSLDWLRSPIKCDWRQIGAPLDPDRLTDADLREICFRMDVILDSIEWERAEGRLLPLELFEPIDTLKGLLAGGDEPPLADWLPLISEFGDYYGLKGVTSIHVRKEAVRDYPQELR